MKEQNKSSLIAARQQLHKLRHIYKDILYIFVYILQV